MSEEYVYEFSELMNDEAALVMLGIFGAVAAVAAVVGLVTYIFQSIGLYSIAKRRGIGNPWLAWLPVGNYWIAGSISDQYHYAVEGTTKKKRFILLWLSIAGMVLSGMVSGASVSTLVDTLEYISADNMEGVVSGVQTGAGGGLISMIQSAVQIATLVFWHMALYDLYTSCNPKHNVLFLVLGIIFGITVPFFIFACRKKDLGMPARREDPQPFVDIPEPRTYQDPWDNT